MRESSVERSAGDLVRALPRQFSGPVLVARLGRGLAWLVIGLVFGCKKGGEEPSRSHGPAFERGDRVVAELVGGEFFEGRVLAVTGERLRIERLRTREVFAAAPGDLYRLPARPAPKEIGRLAICGTAGEEWIGCRIAGESDGELEVTTLDDRKLSLPRSSVLATSQVTELNLKQRFERRAARAQFLAEALAAGEPAPPSGYRPQLQARVVAPKQGQWWSAAVLGLDDEDEEVTLRFLGDGLEQTLPRASVVPESGANAAPTRGAFVLVRPSSPADPWWRARVVATVDSEARIVDGDGDERSVGFRDLLPLGAR
jgi:hypothetical protein